MAKFATIEKTLTIYMTPNDIAHVFCQMPADQQAQFFVQCGLIAKATWDAPPDFQWTAIGNTLKHYEVGREMVETIADGIK